MWSKGKRHTWLEADAVQKIDYTSRITILKEIYSFALCTEIYWSIHLVAHAPWNYTLRSVQWIRKIKIRFIDESAWLYCIPMNRLNQHERWLRCFAAHIQFIIHNLCMLTCSGIYVYAFRLQQNEPRKFHLISGMRSLSLSLWVFISGYHCWISGKKKK